MVIDPEEAGHLAAVTDYIHLNPVRAGLVDLRSEQLGGFLWSSLVEYQAAPRGRAPWLMVERVLGEHGYMDRLIHRRSYIRDLRARALDQQGGTAARWEQIRRGSYLGTTEFRDRLLEKLEKATENVRSALVRPKWAQIMPNGRLSGWSRGTRSFCFERQRLRSCAKATHAK